MSAVFTVFKRDLSRMIYSNVVATIIVLFLLMLGALFFIDFFKDVQALNLRSFFAQAPLLLSVFCPALTMSAIAEEKARHTLTLLQTMPISSAQIVIAKFLSCLALLSGVLIFTLSYPITLSTLGPLDLGPIIGGYIALIMLGGVFIAIGIFASTVSRDQISAFLLAFFISFALTYIHRLSQDASGTTASILQYISANAHFANIARGVVDLRDILYAITIQIFALSAAILQIESQKYPKIAILNAPQNDKSSS